MNKKYSKIFKSIEWVIAIIAIIIFYMTGGQFADELFAQNPDISALNFTIGFGGLFVFILLGYIVSVTFHEAGHLLFGLHAGLVFEEFNVFSISIKKQDNQLKIKCSPKIAGIGGYCSLSMQEDKQYDNNKLILYLLGGIIANLILLLVFLPIALLATNIYLKYFAILMCLTNAYFGINNALPNVSPTGIELDMLKAINTKRDPNYLKTLDRVGNFVSMLQNGDSMQNLNISCPDNFKAPANVLMGMLYIDQLIDGEKYAEAKMLIDLIKKDAGETLSKQKETLLALQFIECELKEDCNIDILKSAWTKDVQKYLKLSRMSNPYFIGYLYAHAKLIANDEKAAKKCLTDIERCSKLANKHDVLAGLEFINFIDELVNKNI